jgi:Ni/Fe-hydrogenase subunit HybB-like protein
MALLGYTFYVPGLLADIGRWYNIWHPTLPSMWQGNSVLFEVGICVMIYLNVQYAELAPIVCERLMKLGDSGPCSWVAYVAGFVSRNLQRIMPALLVLGVALSTFHQSSLGNLMVIAPGKLHALWWTPVSPVLFLLSAIMVGLPMVIFTILCARWSLNQKPELEVLSPLSRYIVPALAVYLAVKVGDLAARGVWPMLLDGSFEATLWLTEVLGGVVLPLVLLAVAKLRRSRRWLGWACLLVILGVVMNRLNVFVLAYAPPYAERVYMPSLVEFSLSIGLVAGLLLVYRVAITYLPILEPRPLVDEVLETVSETAPGGQTAREALT